jgi:hypothetical protein
VLDFVLGFGMILILLFLAPAAIVAARTWAETSRTVSRVARARAGLIGLILGYLTVRHALAADWNGTLRAIARQFVTATLLTGPGLIIAGLLLALLAAPHQRRSVRLLLAGPLGVGPLTSLIGTALICLYCLFVAGRIDSTRDAIIASTEGLIGQAAGGFVGAVLMLVPAVAIFTGATTAAVANLFNAGAAHPLLPALVGPWFVAALGLTAGGAAPLALVVGGPAALALSAVEFLLVRRELRVGLRDAPPPFRVEYGKGWLIKGPRGIWVPLAAAGRTPPVLPAASDRY